MSNTETVQVLWDRAKQRTHTLDELSQLFNDYKDAVKGIAASGEQYKTALHYLPQEWPDLERLIGKKHDVILKGRLIDAITKLKKKIAEIDEEPVAEKPEETAAEETPRVRNMPSLGMD